jgi:hypothetical protein
VCSWAAIVVVSLMSLGLAACDERSASEASDTDAAVPDCSESFATRDADVLIVTPSPDEVLPAPQVHVLVAVGGARVEGVRLRDPDACSADSKILLSLDGRARRRAPGGMLWLRGLGRTRHVLRADLVPLDGGPPVTDEVRFSVHNPRSRHPTKLSEQLRKAREKLARVRTFLAEHGLETGFAVLPLLEQKLASLERRAAGLEEKSVRIVDATADAMREAIRQAQHEIRSTASTVTRSSLSPKYQKPTFRLEPRGRPSLRLR